MSAYVMMAVAFIVMLPNAAYATKPGGTVNVEQTSPQKKASGGSDQHSHTISATVDGIVYDRSKNGKGHSTGPVAPVTNWSPPACWFAPTYTPQQFKKVWVPRLKMGGDQDWVRQLRDKWVNGKPIKNWNLAKTGKGMWWAVQANLDPNAKETTPNCYDYFDFWADNGKKPKQPGAIDTTKLSALAYAQLRVPATKISLSPPADGNQIVNLPT
jgi:enoyl reductase